MCDQTTHLLAKYIKATYLGTAQQHKAIETIILAGELFVIQKPSSLVMDLCCSSSKNCNGTIGSPWLLWMKHTYSERGKHSGNNQIHAYHSFMHTLIIHSSMYTHAWHTLKCMHTYTHTHTHYRPKYKMLTTPHGLFPGVPVMALTATATPVVKKEVLDILTNPQGNLIS